MVDTTQSERNKMILRIALATGMRVGDISNLKKSNVFIE